MCALPLLVFYCPRAAGVAVIETYEFSIPRLEERYQALSEELRCPKCQNQNIADSNAPISQDLAALALRAIGSGASDDEIRQYMVDRYGEFVRYQAQLLRGHRVAVAGADHCCWLAGRRDAS